MTHIEFEKLNILDKIMVDFNFSNIHIKGIGVVIRKYPNDDNWMDLEAVVIEEDGTMRQGPLDRESCSIIPVVEMPNIVMSSVANSPNNCLIEIINVLKKYGMV